MSGSDSTPIKSRLREERIRHNWSQMDLADKLGSTQVTVNRWERGVQQPSAFFRTKLCQLFGKSAEELDLLPNVPFAQPLPDAPTSDEEPSHPPEPVAPIDAHDESGEYIETFIPSVDIYPPTPQEVPTRTEEQYRQNRIRMLARLRHTYSELLAHSLQGTVKLELGLTELPDAVQNAANLLLQVREQTTQQQLPEISLLQAYEKSEYELLILGAPGSGKSMLLLELAQQLVLRAQEDGIYPLPVLLPLSSWAQKRAPLDAWLVAQLGQIYHVPVGLTKHWIQTGQLLPLLDGLDEMDEDARPACITAINAYHRSYLAPLVICSRYAEYEVAARRERLHLLGALLVQPLSQGQIESYLNGVDAQVLGLRMALHDDADLQELVKTPLMLNVLTLAYRGTPLHEITALETLPAKQRRIFATYVQRMLARQGSRARAAPERTVHWLSYLAQQMRDHNETFFYLEHIQPDWLAPRGRRGYTLFGVLLPDILIGIFVSLSLYIFIDTILQGALDLDIWRLIVVGMLGGLLGGLFSKSTLGRINRSREQISRQYEYCNIQREKHVLRFIKTMHPLSVILAIGGVILSVGLGIGLSEGHLGIGLSVGLGAGLSSVLLSLLLNTQTEDIQLTERLRWTWGSLFASEHWTITLVLTICVTILIGLGYWWLDVQMFGDSLIQGLGVGLGIGLSAGLGMGLSYWLLLGLFQGVSSEQIEAQLREVPGQGVRASLHRGLLMGLISWGVLWLISTLCYGVTTWLIWVPSNGLAEGFQAWLDNDGPNVVLFWALSWGWVVGLYGGLVVCLVSGGLAAWRHGIIRLFLQRSGMLPRRCVHFFNYAASSILLQRVGGGYSFIHRLLLDYFAERE